MLALERVHNMCRCDYIICMLCCWFIFIFYFLVPPVLSKQSNTTVYARTGSVVTFSTVIYDAQPPVTLDYVSWRGNFDPDQQEVTYENATVSLILSDLEVTNTGTITVIIYHPARVVNQTYELIVLSELLE